jgi:hypothetical protein
MANSVRLSIPRGRVRKSRQGHGFTIGVIVLSMLLIAIALESRNDLTLPASGESATAAEDVPPSDVAPSMLAHRGSN